MDGINFIHENNYPVEIMRQHNVTKRTHPGLQRTEHRALCPEIYEFILKLKLCSDLAEQSAIPLLNGEVEANRRQVKNRDAKTKLTQACGSMNH